MAIMCTEMMVDIATKVFLILGQNCNLHCKYCFERTKEKPQEITQETLDFLRGLKRPLLINFYGGEPLLYIDTIKKVVEYVGNEDVIYTTMTNGTLLNEDTVTYLNRNNITVNLSWDGTNTEQTRGVDVIKTNLDNICKIKHLWVNASLTPLSYPLEVCNAFNVFAEKYKSTQGYYPSLHIGLVSPTDKTLDLNRVHNEMLQIMQTLKFGGGVGELSVAHSVISTMIKHHKDYYDIDVQGNFYLCPLNPNTKNCSVVDVDEYNKIKKPLPPDKCTACNFLSACHGGCKMQLDRGCELRKAFYSPFFETF